MSGFASLLLFAAFFYLMMRFGCGAHMVHGGHGGHSGHGEDDMHGGGGMTGMKTKDPVCGMEVEPGQGYSKVHEGREYRFCSRKCLDQFDADPKRYALTGMQQGNPNVSETPTGKHDAGCH